MIVRGLYEVIQEVIHSHDDVARALHATELFSHDSGCIAVCLLSC